MSDIINKFGMLLNFVLVSEPPKSNLSAEAKEWYPPNYMPQQTPTYAPEPVHTTYRPRRSVQDRLRQAQDQNPYNFEEMSGSLDDVDGYALRVRMFYI